MVSQLEHGDDAAHELAGDASTVVESVLLSGCLGILACRCGV